MRLLVFALTINLSLAALVITAFTYFGGLNASASTTENLPFIDAQAIAAGGIPSCHASNGSYVRSLVASASAASAQDIVPPAGAAAGKNWDHAHIAVWVYGCKTPPNITRSIPPAKPADPNAGKYPLETGPVQ